MTPEFEAAKHLQEQVDALVNLIMTGLLVGCFAAAFIAVGTGIVLALRDSRRQALRREVSRQTRW